MSPQFAIHILAEALLAAFWICAPLLVIAFSVGIAINLLQVVTSMQDPVFSTVPRLLACLGGMLVFLPYMLHKAAAYAIAIFADLGQYAR